MKIFMNGFVQPPTNFRFGNNKNNKKKLITVQKIPGSAMKTKEDTIIPRFSFKISFYVRFVNCKKLLLVNDPNFISFCIYLQTNIHV